MPSDDKAVQHDPATRVATADIACKRCGSTNTVSGVGKCRAMAHLKGTCRRCCRPINHKQYLKCAHA